VVATLYALAEKGQLDRSEVQKAIKQLKIEPEKIFPQNCVSFSRSYRVALHGIPFFLWRGIETMNEFRVSPSPLSGGEGWGEEALCIPAA